MMPLNAKATTATIATTGRKSWVTMLALCFVFLCMINPSFVMSSPIVKSGDDDSFGDHNNEDSGRYDTMALPEGHHHLQARVLPAVAAYALGRIAIRIIARNAVKCARSPTCRNTVKDYLTGYGQTSGSAVETEECPAYPRIRKNNYAFAMSTDELVETTVSSTGYETLPQMCASTCGLIDWCKAFQTSDVEGLCQLIAVPIASDAQIIADDSWTYYELE